MKLSEAMHAFKRQYIIAALAKCKGNQCAAADELGIHRNTLSRDCDVLGIDPSAYVQPGNKREYINHPGIRAAL